MKIHRILSIILATAALLGLGGCATSLTKEGALSRFTPGEQTLYGVVPGSPQKLIDIKDFQKKCGKEELNETTAASVNTWMANTVCPDISKWQVVSIVFQTKVWGMDGVKFLGAYAPAHWNIEKDDILQVSVSMSDVGQAVRPSVVERIARKAKDATKESGCYWDGGKGATTAFIGGGAVCDGWNWRDQKFAKE